MGRSHRVVLLPCLFAAVIALCRQVPAAAPDWTIYVTNDNCPDYTWGLTEQQTRQAYADVIKGHLDEMKRTDGQPWYNQDRYNAAVTQEVICFLEKYPDRKDELVRRIKEGRLYVSPYLCNTLWGLQSAEATIRAFYPARRLERELGVPMQYAHHIELPSLPWGTPTILAGCGIKALSVPYYNYDSTFGGLTAPPIFWHEGPDGSRILVCMDRFACGKASYTQGAYLLRKPDLIEKEWLPHYAGLGKDYPLHSILASGTHGDISPTSGSQARGFADAIIKYNSRPDAKVRLVNATLPQFWQAVEKEQSQPGAPPLPVVRGDFGHSWELWPVSLAVYAGMMRDGERGLIGTEGLLAIAGYKRPGILQSTSYERSAAQWCWTMLADHAWNGTDDRNRAHNASLRAEWAAFLFPHGYYPRDEHWEAIGIEPGNGDVFVFNATSMPRPVFTSVLGEAPVSVWDGGNEIPSQTVASASSLLFVAPAVPAFGLRQFTLKKREASGVSNAGLTASPDHLENRYYRLRVDPKTGGLCSAVYKPTGREFVLPGSGRALGQTVFFDGKEHPITDVRSRVSASGAVLVAVETHGKAADIEVTTTFTLFADLDHIQVVTTLHKPPSTSQHRLCQVFPVVGTNAKIRVATPGAVVRPRPQPEGDLLPGADSRRMAAQEFVDVSQEDFGVTVSPSEAFALRLDLTPITFEALGNDQNYREVVRNQDGREGSMFVYNVRAHAGGYRSADAYAWAQAVSRPMLHERCRSPQDFGRLPRIEIDPKRAIATCLKPASAEEPTIIWRTPRLLDVTPEGGDAGPQPGRRATTPQAQRVFVPEPNGVILRLQETAGKSGPLEITIDGYSRAVQTDLLERDLKPLAVTGGKVTLELKANGFAAVRLLK